MSRGASLLEAMTQEIANSCCTISWMLVCCHSDLVINVKKMPTTAGAEMESGLENVSTAREHAGLPASAFAESESAFIGVFPDLNAAFFDTVRLSFPKPLLPRPWKLLTEEKKQRCGGPGRRYGYSSDGLLDWTGNRYHANYVKWSRLPNVPEALLWLNSEVSPLTVAEIRRASCCFSKHAAQLSGVDIAWDLPSNFNDISRSLVSRITRRRLLLVDHKTGRRTLYFGTRQGERQVCLYDKAPGVVRLEVRLRRRALRRLGITSVDQLPLLRNVDFRPLVAFCELRVPVVVGERHRRGAWQYFAQHQPLDRLAREFTEHYRVPRQELLRPIALDARIRRMQRNLLR